MDDDMANFLKDLCEPVERQLLIRLSVSAAQKAGKH
jgi:hypothetical protein